MKSLHIIQTPARYYPSIGGVEQYAREVAAGLTHLGHQVKVVCANEPVSSVTRDQGVQIERLKTIGKIANTDITPGLLSCLWKKNFDLIHTYMPTPWSADISALVAAIKHKPLILSYFNDISGQTFLTSIVAAFYNRLILPFLLGRSRKIIVSTKEYIDRSRYLKPYEHKIVVIPPGVDTKRFTPGTKKSPPTLFFLSVLDEYHQYKGLTILLQAIQIVCQKNKTITLTIGGEGKLKSQYQKQVRDLGIWNRVTFVGRIKEAQLPRYFQEASLLVLPSTEKEEGFGLVTIEALASATPVIISDMVGIAREVKQYNTGVVVATNDVDDLAKAILYLDKNPKKRFEMGQNGRTLVKQQFNWPMVIKQIEEVYLSCLS